jgi:N utilization substance protein B
MSETKKTPNLSLQKKTAARLVAVQCLYMQAATKEKTTPAEQVAQVKAQLINNKNEQKLMLGSPIEPNYSLLEALLTGAAQHEEEISKRLESVLDKGWKAGRMSPLLLAILQCGIFEIFFYKDTAANILIDEYTRLTRSFFADAEVDFTHGALKALAKKYHG